MAYVDPNYKTKKELKTAIAEGKVVHVFSPGPFTVTQNGELSVEGPHAPKPHTWYARAKVENGRVVRVVS